MQNAQTEVFNFFRQLNFSGKIVVGGSQAFGEATRESDKDFYLIANNISVLRKILRQKDRVVKFKVENNLSVDFVLLTRWLLKHKFYYLYGYDEQGKVFSPAYDHKLLRNNNLKLAYRALIQSGQSTEPRRTYLLAKALVYGIYAWALMVKESSLLQPPLYSAQKIIEKIDKVVCLTDKERAVGLLQAKLGETRQANEADMKLVASVLDKVYREFLLDSFSWRSYLLYQIFSLKNGCFDYFWQNPDKCIVKGFRGLLNHYDERKYSLLDKDTFKILVI